MTQIEVRAMLHLMGLNTSPHNNAIYYIRLRNKLGELYWSSIFFASNSITYKQHQYTKHTYTKLIKHLSEDLNIV